MQPISSTQRHSPSIRSILCARPPRPPLRAAGERRKRALAEYLDAANAVCGYVALPPRLRGYVDAVIGASFGQEHVEAGDKVIAARLGCSTKTVQRLRKQLIDWQRESAVTLIVSTPGDKLEEEYVQTAYELPILSLCAEVLVEARRDSRYSRDRLAALKDAAADALLGRPEIAPLRLHKPKRRSPRSELERLDKTMLTLMAKRRRLTPGSESDRDAAQEALCAKLRQVGRDEVVQVKTVGKNVDSFAPAEVGAQGAASPASDLSEPVAPAVTAPPVSPPSALSLGSWLEAPQVDKLSTLNAAKPRKVSTLEISPIPILDNPVTSAVELFASVGAATFDVTVLQEQPAKEELYYLPAQPAGVLREEGGAWAEVAEERSASLIIRPRGEGLIQADDLSAEAVERVRPFAFAVVETSLGNFQAWFALADGEREQVRRRLLERLGADKGASGALRWPGSLNCKPIHGPDYPRVALTSAQPGRRVTVAELEGAGLLAPLPRPLVRPLRPISARPGNRPWPSYERELAGVRRKGDGTPDRSEADFRWCLLAAGRGFTLSDIAAELPQVSASAKAKGSRYTLRTARSAFDKAGH